MTDPVSTTGSADVSEREEQLAFDKLTNELAELFSKEDEARMVVGNSGLRATTIDFGGSAVVFWTKILIKAKQKDKLDALVAYVAEEPRFPGRGDTLRHLLAEWRKAEKAREVEEIVIRRVKVSLLGEINFAVVVLVVAGAVIYYSSSAEVVGAVLAGLIGLGCIAVLGALHRAVSAAVNKPSLERTVGESVANILGRKLVTAALFAVIAAIITLAYINRPSNTSIAFQQADQNVIQIVASNGGGKPSVVRRAELKFGPINIEDRQLVVHSVVVPAGGTLRIDLLVEGLITRVRPGGGGRFKIAEVLPQLRTNNATLVIEVDESNGRRARTESMEGVKFEYLIQHKLVEE